MIFEIIWNVAMPEWGAKGGCHSLLKIQGHRSKESELLNPRDVYHKIINTTLVPNWKQWAQIRLSQHKQNFPWDCWEFCPCRNCRIRSKYFVYFNSLFLFLQNKDWGQQYKILPQPLHFLCFSSTRQHISFSSCLKPECFCFPEILVLLPTITIKPT